MQWYKWLIWDFQANSILREIDRQLDELHLRAVTLTEESRTRLASLMVQMLLKLMPDYDFRRGFYAQFVLYSSNHKPQMIQLADKLNDFHKAAVEGKDIELEIMFGLLKAFTLLLALKTSSAYANWRRREIFDTRARSMNDIVQHFIATKLNDLAVDWHESTVFYPE